MRRRREEKRGVVSVDGGEDTWQIGLPRWHCYAPAPKTTEPSSGAWRIERILLYFLSLQMENRGNVGVDNVFFVDLHKMFHDL